jgi:hypothetical protein
VPGLLRLYRLVRLPLRITTVISVLVLLGSFSTLSPSAQAQADTSVPTVQGPISGPGPAYSSLSACDSGCPNPTPGTSLSDFGYVTQEYFVSGVADGSPYATRIVVRRPASPRRFSGLVVAEPMHFSGAALICQYAQLGIAESGDACLEIDAEPLDLGLLQAFNSARYGSLSIVSEAQTNDILAQVGRLVRSNAPDSPLAGFPVRDMVLTGISESSDVTRAYMSAYDTGASTFLMPDGSPIYQGYFLSSTLGPDPLPITNVPTIQMPTQNEVTAGEPGNGESSSFQRPDSNSPSNPFRIYEVAAMSHADVRNLPNNMGCILPFSQFPQGAMVFMGLEHDLNWVAYGIVPPHAPSYIAVNPGNQVIDGTRVALDQFGNAIGGVRTPYVDVPIFKYTIPNYNIPDSAGTSFTCSIAGFQTPLPESVLHSLYKNEGQYLSEVNHDLHKLTAEGWWPEQYTQSTIRADSLAYAKEFLSPASA